MNGSGFMAAVFFWVVMVLGGAVLVAVAFLDNNPLPLAIVFGLTWVSLTLYWAWRLGNLR